MDNAIYGSAKAWCRFNPSSGAIVGLTGYNVSSVTLVATGNFTINFTNAFADTNYATMGAWTRNATTPASNTTIFGVLTIATGSVGVSTVDTSATATNGLYVGVAVFR
jgi:hypothetical protein